MEQERAIVGGFSSGGCARRMVSWFAAATGVLGCLTEATAASLEARLDATPRRQVAVSGVMPEDLAIADVPVETAIPLEPGWRWKVFPHLTLGGYFDDNIFISEQDEQQDFIGILAPGVAFGLGEIEHPLSRIRQERGVPLIFADPREGNGNFLLADYTASAVGFADHTGESSLDHEALLSAMWAPGRLRLGLETYFRALSRSEIDVGSRVRREEFGIGLSSRYDLGGKMSWDSLLGFTNTHYIGRLDSREWLIQEWINWEFSAKTTFGIGAGWGRLEVEESPTQHYLPLLARVVWKSSEKLTFSGRAGAEYRWVEEGSRWNPIFGLGAIYDPFVNTRLELEAFREITASALLEGQNYSRTGVTMALRQTVADRLYFKLRGGYEHSDYFRVAEGDSADREEDYFFVRPSVAFDLTRWTNTEIFYQYRTNDSTREGDSFGNNQVGIEMNFAF